jgi:uncharacterized protein YlzI (FlbEa/FlbD family)
MLIPIIDAESGNKVYVNPQQVAVIFQGVNPEGVQLTMINLLNGNVATAEPIDEVVEKLQGGVKLGSRG